MKKLVARLVGAALLSLALSIIFVPTPAAAFERADHDDMLEEAIFGRANVILGDASDSKSALESAVYLCLDQMRSNGQHDRETLVEYKVPNPPTIEEIDLSSIFYGDHDGYTHRGWHYDYGDQEVLGEKWEPRWQNRKRLLQNTVRTVFDFGFFENVKMTFGIYEGTKCDAFSKLLYYVHILGDYQDAIQENIEKENYKMDLAAIPYATKNAGNNNRDLYWDLSESLETLFKDEGDDYERLVEEIDARANRARSIGEVRNKTSAEAFRKNVISLRRCIKKYVPDLLRKSDFFNTAFGSNT